MKRTPGSRRKPGRTLHGAVLAALLAAVLVLAAGCGSSDSGEGGAPEIGGLTYAETMELDYADCFDIYRYEGGYSVIDVHEDSSYLVVPAEGEVPEELPEGMVVIRQKLENIYLGATSAMALFDSIDALDQVSMTELKKGRWTVESAREAMEKGAIVYAGKYSEPDYELILERNCDLAIESTMIYHNPEVKEMLEKLGIPVFVDRSSYESRPLGRTEWVKVYGVLTGREEAAEQFFAEQEEVVSELEDYGNTEKTVAWFYVTTAGKVVVRSNTDYIPAMIEMAGGRYAFPDLTDDSGRTSLSMTMESFYEGAADADILIYNTNIDGTVKSLSDLEEKSEIFAKFRAVREDSCYASGSSFYQRTDEISTMIMDLHRVLTEEDPSELKYLTKLE